MSNDNDSQDRALVIDQAGAEYVVNRKQVVELLEAWLAGTAPHPSDYGRPFGNGKRPTNVIDLRTLTEDKARALLQDARKGGPWG